MVEESLFDSLRVLPRRGIAYAPSNDWAIQSRATSRARSSIPSTLGRQAFELLHPVGGAVVSYVAQVQAAL